MNSERIDELIALAALGELSVADELELEGAAMADPAVAHELAEALASAATIQALGAEEPPAALRANVLAAIRAIPRDVSDVAAPREPRGPGTPPPTLDERRRRRWLPVVVGLAAAGLLVIAGEFVVSNQASAPDQVSAIVDASDAQSRALAGSMEGSLQVVYSKSADALVVEGKDVPVLDSSQTYQLWLVDDSGATSVGLFRPDGEGRVSKRFDGVDPTGFVVGVTEEPAAGSTSPTLPIIASA